MTRLAAGALVLLLTAACFRSETVEFSKTTRFPDDQGVVTDVDFERIELDGKRKHPVNRQLQSFSTYNGEVTALLSWKDKYIHLGLDDDKTVVWMAGIGLVDRTFDPPIVRYANGLLRRIDSKRNAIFADGTVIKLAADMEIPPTPVNHRFHVKIDPSKHEAIDMRGTAAPPD